MVVTQMGRTGEALVTDIKVCSRLFATMESLQPSSSSLGLVERVGNRPFDGLVICVTGLSKEARKQVMDATEKLGGQYSPNLHPRCTHLVVQSFGGRKFEHALKHGLRNGLFVVTLGWFLDSVRKNVRLSESLYSVKSAGESGLQAELNHLVRVSDSEKSCVPAGLHEYAKQSNITQQAHQRFCRKESSTKRDLVLSGHSMYVDSEISDDVQKKLIDAATEQAVGIIRPWFVGCNASYVVCEGPSVCKYLGHTDNIVTPQWILGTIKENHMQRLVHMSPDLARQVSGIIENLQTANVGQSSTEHATGRKSTTQLEERQQIVDSAKAGVRNRRPHHMQKTQTHIRPITPSTLLDSICWSVSDPTSTASVYTDSSMSEDCRDNNSLSLDAKVDRKGPETSFENLCRPLRESEKLEKIFRNHFLTILFPIDRFAEMGPSSKTFFSDTGFTCLQLLEYIYKFYQDNMSEDEVVTAIHTDSKHADRLRSVYASNESLQSATVKFKRIDFLGTRRSFEMLKRVSGDNNSNVYELLIRA